MADSLTVYEVVNETEVFRLSWYNSEKNIFVLEIKQQWRWEDAIISAKISNENVVSQAPNPVYTVYYYRMKTIPLIPKGLSLANMRKLIEIDLANEQLVIFVHFDSMLSSLVRVVSKAYTLRYVFQKYRFVNTFPDALAEIQKHQQSQNPNSGAKDIIPIP